MLEPAQIQLQEAVYSLRHYQQRLELDPAAAARGRARLDAVHTRGAQVQASRSRTFPDASRKIEGAPRGAGDGAIPTALREREAEGARPAYRERAKKLSAARKKAAADLGEESDRGDAGHWRWRGGAFEVALNPLAEGSAHGLEQVEFLVAGHAGSTPRPLAKVASGGELSRISLAIQTVTSQVAEVPTLIFDEVDAGIGGRVAEIVGRMLQAAGHAGIR